MTLKIVAIEVRDLSEAWFQCIRNLFRSGHEYVIQKGSFESQRRLEFDFVTIHITHPGSRPLVPDVPVGVPPPTTMDYVVSYLPYLMTNKPKDGEQYTYGMYLEPQISKVIETLRKTPMTNQSYMTIGDPSTIDFKDPPCLRGIDCRVLNDCLHFMVYFRSWDLWAGFPSNLAAIQMLKEYMSEEIGVKDGELIACSKGLHLYDYSWELARSVVDR